jgi:hypothetical protein
MKIQCLLGLFLLIAGPAMSQKYLPKIKSGTVLTYGVESSATGQKANATLTIVSLNNSVRIKWDIPFVGTGFFEMTAKSIQSANKTIAEEPDPDVVTRIDDDKTLVLLSKDEFTSLRNNKSFILNKYTFHVQADTSNYKINDKLADVYYAVSTHGNRQIWILNNPNFPLICRASKLTPIDFWLTAIVE